MFYQLTDAFKARQWQERRTLKDLDLALHEARAAGSGWIARGAVCPPTLVSSRRGSPP